jgi:hypothetical protein
MAAEAAGIEIAATVAAISAVGEAGVGLVSASDGEYAQTVFCKKKVDNILNDTIFRQLCNKDCEKRINLDREVSVRVCINAECEYFKPNPYPSCTKYLNEGRHKHKPTKFNKPHRIDRRGAVGGWHYRDV